MNSAHGLLTQIKAIGRHFVYGVQSYAKPFFALLLTVLFSGFAWAWPPTYGPEFEFTTQKLKDGYTDLKTSSKQDSLEDRAHQEFAAYLEESVCPQMDCVVKKVRGKWNSSDYKVEFSDGWFFTVSFDPMVVEITFKPLTLAGLYEKRDLIQTAIFQSAKEFGLITDQSVTSGHFNVGVKSATKNKAENFLRFFVDFANHPELSLGVLGEDWNNAPTLSFLKESQRQALQQLIEKQRGPERFKKIAELTRYIQDFVYTHTRNENWGPEHYQAMGLKQINKANLDSRDAPFELRAVRGQRNVDEFILLAELFEARLAFLNAQIGKPILYDQISRTIYNERELRTRFYIYITEMGLPFEKFEPLMPENLRKISVDPMFVGKNPKLALESIERYWDLLVHSEFVRNRVREILMDPKNLKEPLRNLILARINAESAKEYSAPKKKSWKSIIGFGRFQGSQMTVEEFEYRSSVWQDFNMKLNAPMCGRVLLQAQ